MTPKKGSLLAREAREPISRGRSPRPLRRPRRGATRPRESARRRCVRAHLRIGRSTVGTPVVPEKARVSLARSVSDKSRAGLTEVRDRDHPVVPRRHCTAPAPRRRRRFDYFEFAAHLERATVPFELTEETFRTFLLFKMIK